MCLLPYISEFTAMKLRPLVANGIAFGMALGMLYVPGFALLIFRNIIEIQIWDVFKISGWRILLCIYLMPGIISFGIMLFMPESAKFYKSKNMPDEAYAVLEKVCRYNKGKDVTLKSLGYDKISPPSEIQDPHLWKQIRPLFDKEHRCITTELCIITFMLFATGFGLTVWLPRVLYYTKTVEENAILCHLFEIGVNINRSTSAINHCIVRENLLYDGILDGTICLITLTLITILLLILSRKTVFLLLTIISILAGFMLNFINFFVVGLFIFFTVPPLCSYRVAVTILLDIIPTSLRTKTMSLTTVSGRAGALFTNIYVGYLLEVNCFVTFNTYVLFMVIVFVISLQFPSNEQIKNNQNNQAK